MEDYRSPVACLPPSYAAPPDPPDSWLSACFPSYLGGSPGEDAGPFLDAPCEPRISAYPDSAFSVVADAGYPYAVPLGPPEPALGPDTGHAFLASLDEIMEPLSPFAEPLGARGAEAEARGAEGGRRRRRLVGLVDRRFLQRSAANRRERKRMLLINQHFEVLRAALPPHAHPAPGPGASQDDRRLSKVETLKSAIAYIADLAAYLRALGSQDGPSEADSPARLRVRLEEPVLASGGMIIREVTLSFARKEIGSKSEEGTVKSTLWFPAVVPVPDLTFAI